MSKGKALIIVVKMGSGKAKMGEERRGKGNAWYCNERQCSGIEMRSTAKRRQCFARHGKGKAQKC